MFSFIDRAVLASYIELSYSGVKLKTCLIYRAYSELKLSRQLLSLSATLSVIHQ